MSALDRHRSHIVATVRKRVERREVERAVSIVSKWGERLEQAYGSAERGVETASNDPKQWPAGARYLAVMAKLIETGLQVDGVIGPNAIGNTTTTTFEQVLMLPQVSTSIESTCDAIESSDTLDTEFVHGSDVIDSKDSQ